MDKKLIAVISYITIIGWLFSYFQFKDKAKDPFVTYHLKQSLGISIIGLILGVVLQIVIGIVPALGILGYVNLVVLVFWVLGILSAVKGEMKPLPIVGAVFQQKLSFLD